MQILHVIQGMARNLGGPQSVLADLARAQAVAGLCVEVATTNINAPSGVLDVSTDHAVELDGVQFHYFPVQFRPLLVSRTLRSYIDDNIVNFDIIHIHGLYRFPVTYSAARARHVGVPYIIQPHGSLAPYLYAQSSRSLLLKRTYERWFDFPNLNAAGAIHYTSEDERRGAAVLNLRAPSFVVPNGIDWERYRTLPARGGLRAQWGLRDEPIVLFLGRIHFKKGLDLLIPAFDSLRRRLPSAQLVIAGPENDDYGKKVRSWVRDCALERAVHFVGPLSGKDVVQAYVDANVFALPSYTENFGMAVAEAMACALPVVISDQVNIHAEVTKAGAGLVTRCDAAELAEALHTLLVDPDRRRIMGAAGRRLVQQRYTWPLIVNALTHEYEAAIDRSHRTPPEHSPSPT